MPRAARRAVPPPARARARALVQILCHLRNYTEPVFQRYIIRLVFMVPVYAAGSWFSLRYRAAAIYFDTLRDWCGLRGVAEGGLH